MRYICLLILLPASALGLSLERLDYESSFGAWDIYCERFEDMGGVTYFECAASDRDGLYVQALDDGYVRLVLQDHAEMNAFSLEPCEENVCSAPMPTTEFLALVTAGFEINNTALNESGLAEAIAEMERLLH